MATIVFGFKAIKPIRAEHPVGSGTIVTYQPGEEVPAGDWGRAMDALVEQGKIMRYATNVYEPGELGGSAPPVTLVQKETDEFGVPSGPWEPTGESLETSGPSSPSGEMYPQALSGGTFLLSDGSKVRGKKAAVTAQAALDVAAEG